MSSMTVPGTASGRKECDSHRMRAVVEAIACRDGNFRRAPALWQVPRVIDSNAGMPSSQIGHDLAASMVPGRQAAGPSCSRGFTTTIVAACLFACAATAAAQSVVINEIMAANDTTLADPDFGRFGDWVEIFNPTAAAFDLSGFFLTDDENEIARWRFPAGTSVGPLGHMLVWTDGQDVGLHTNFRLSAEGESIGLYDPDGNVVDLIYFGPQAPDVSFGRAPDGGPDWGYFNLSTPGEQNAPTAYDGIAAPPSFSLPRGAFPPGSTVALATDLPGATVHFTTDGSPPTEASPVFSDEIVLLSTTVVRAAVFREGFLPSPVITQTYLVGETTSLPIVSLATDRDNFFDDEIGIYVEGTNGIPGYCRSIPLNWNQDWERPVHVEFFESDRSTGFSLDAGVKIHGGCTRIYPQKSLAIYARSIYGPSRIEYAIFADREFKSYNNLVLRSSAQDWWRSMFRDGLIQTVIADGMDLETMAYRPAIVLLNGAYWGIHNLREKQNAHYFADRIGFDPEAIEILDTDSGDWIGQSDHYDEMISFMLSTDMTRSEALDVVDTYMDVDAYIDYLAAEIFVANADWPGNNVKAWRPRAPGGRWRWAIYDLDMGYAGNANSQYYSNTLALATDPNGGEWPNPPWSTLLLRTLLQNPDFRNEFIQRFAAHVNTTFEPQKVLLTVDSLRAAIADEIPRHKQRWPQSISFSSTWEDAIDLIRDFAARRARYVRPHFYDYFGISGSSRLTLRVLQPAAGYIEAHGVKMPGPEFGAVFFRDVPVQLKAVAHPGYRFDRWEGAVQSSTDTTSLVLSDNMDLTAVFVEDGTATTVDVETPFSDNLSQNHPNPFSSATRIEFEVSSPGEVSLRLFDVLGRRVATLTEGYRSAGRHSVVLDAGTLNSGVYFYTLTTAKSTSTRSLSIVR